MNTKEKLYVVKSAGIWSEVLGGIPSTLVGAGVGAGATGLLTGLGQTLGKGKIDGKAIMDAATGGAVLGAGGSYIANGLGGPLAALFTKTRNFEEQKEGEKELLSNLLIPGRSSYNLYKRLGHSARGKGSPAEAAEKE